MQLYCKLQAGMDVIQQQIVGAKKNERAYALKDGFTVWILKGARAEGRTK